MELEADVRHVDYIWTFRWKRCETPGELQRSACQNWTMSSAEAWRCGSRLGARLATAMKVLGSLLSPQQSDSWQGTWSKGCRRRLWRCDSEYFGMCRTAILTKFVKRVLAFYIGEVKAVRTTLDSSVAEAMAQRKGVWNIRHVRA